MTFAQECIVPGCHGVMVVVARDEAWTTREWSCKKGAHIWVELRDGTKRVEREAKP